MNISTNFPKIFLKKGKERSLIHFHPWVFSGAIQKKEREPAEGEIVEVYSLNAEYLGTGHFHSGSISVRIFSFQKTLAEDTFWKEKIQAAYKKRMQLGFGGTNATNAYRLVFAEGDGMPGMIIDIYNDTAILQAHTTGMYLLRETFTNALKEIYGSTLTTIYDKSSETGEKNQPSLHHNGFLFETKERPEKGNWISENGLKFFVNYEEGQKTGFFIDQRDNRELLKKYAKDKIVLNTFAYSGGFSAYALAGGAQLVHSVDSSNKAAEWALKNMEANFGKANHQFYTEDVFDFFKRAEQQYDIILLDPPAFAKRLSALKQACSGYQRLNEIAFRKIKAGGLIFTFSCSQVIDRKLFRQLVFAAAASSKRNVTILHQLSQPADHPISMYHPEGEYLKGLVLRVD